jgi:hypothetical protein
MIDAGRRVEAEVGTGEVAALVQSNHARCVVEHRAGPVVAGQGQCARRIPSHRSAESDIAVEAGLARQTTRWGPSLSERYSHPAHPSEDRHSQDAVRTAISHLLSTRSLRIMASSPTFAH